MSTRDKTERSVHTACRGGQVQFPAGTACGALGTPVGSDCFFQGGSPDMSSEGGGGRIGRWTIGCLFSVWPIHSIEDGCVARLRLVLTDVVVGTWGRGEGTWGSLEIREKTKYVGLPTVLPTSVHTYPNLLRGLPFFRTNCAASPFR